MIQGGREIVSRRIIALLVPYFLRLLNRAMPDDFSEIVNDELRMEKTSNRKLLSTINAFISTKLTSQMMNMK